MGGCSKPCQAFFVLALLGMVPGTFATTVFGRQLAAALKDPDTINYWVVGGIVVVFAILLVGAKRWLSKLEAGPAGGDLQSLTKVSAAPVI